MIDERLALKTKPSTDTLVDSSPPDIGVDEISTMPSTAQRPQMLETLMETESSQIYDG